MNSTSTVDTKSDERSDHIWDVATVTLVMCEKLDLESLSKKDGCTVRFIKREGETTEYEFTMGPTPTCPAGTQASIEIEDDGSVIKVVTTDFLSRHALLDFLHYVLNVGLGMLEMTGICLQGCMGDVRHQTDEGIFASLWI